MSDVYFAEPTLDLSPMIQALKFQPSDFELSGGWLVHVPSRHRFKFGSFGRLTIDAHCGCASLRARREQEGDLMTAFDQWRFDYWRVVEINREFASHFAPVGRLRKFARDVRMAFRRLRRSRAGTREIPSAISVPAE